MGVETAIITSALIGAGTSMYQSEQQKKALKSQEEELRRQEEAKRLEMERIARETRPEGETLKSVKFGAPSAQSSTTGSLNDFLVPIDTSNSQLSSSTTGSLGFII